mmetsp:Transcript_10539/g.16881  ORF Transcript_10539/g.16881 Transcript_10539/m.16881 type:complete len:90 (+) Transcript_10539:146-415(+)
MCSVVVAATAAAAAGGDEFFVDVKWGGPVKVYSIVGVGLGSFALNSVDGGGVVGFLLTSVVGVRLGGFSFPLVIFPPTPLLNLVGLRSA